MLLGGAAISRRPEFLGPVNLVVSLRQPDEWRRGAHDRRWPVRALPCYAIFVMHNAPCTDGHSVQQRPSMSSSLPSNHDPREGGHASGRTSRGSIFAGPGEGAAACLAQRRPGTSVVTIGTLHSGTVRNVIPESVNEPDGFRSATNGDRCSSASQSSSRACAGQAAASISNTSAATRARNSPAETEFAVRLPGPRRPRGRSSLRHCHRPRGPLTSRARPGSFVRIGNATADVHSAT